MKRPRDTVVANGWRLLPEAALTLAVLVALGNVANRFIVDGKLPQPFIFDINDTFMDWFNTAYWAHHSGAFTVWRTVYPPFSFAFLKLFGLPDCYVNDAISARSCDTVGIVAILCCYVLVVALAAIAFRRRDRVTAPFRAIAYAFSLPLLFTLERGNLILPCLIFFIVGHGALVGSRWARGLMLAVTINFKPYLLLPILALAWKREWRQLEITGFATMLVYAAGYAIVGEGSPIELVGNTLNWVNFTGGLIFEQIYYSTSFAPFLQFDTPIFPTRDFIASDIIDWLVFVIPIAIRSSQLVGIAALAGAWLQPGAVPTARISTLLLAVSLIGQSPGGYTETFLVFTLFLEPWRRAGPITALVAGYLLCVPYDLVLSNILTLTGDSWLSGRPVTAPFGIAAGIFVRPALILLILWALSLDTLSQVVRAHRTARPTLDPHPATMLGRPELAG